MGKRERFMPWDQKGEDKCEKKNVWGHNYQDLSIYHKFKEKKKPKIVLKWSLSAWLLGDVMVKTEKEMLKL